MGVDVVNPATSANRSVDSSLNRHTVPASDNFTDTEFGFVSPAAGEPHGGIEADPSPSALTKKRCLTPDPMSFMVSLPGRESETRTGTVEVIRSGTESTAPTGETTTNEPSSTMKTASTRRSVARS